MARKFKIGDRVWLPDGRRGTVIPRFRDSKNTCVLPDFENPLFIEPRELRKMTLLDQVAEAANAVETGYSPGQRIILPTKEGLVDTKVELVTVNGEIVLFDGATLVVAHRRV